MSVGLSSGFGQYRTARRLLALASNALAETKAGKPRSSESSQSGLARKVPPIMDLKLKPFDFAQAVARAGLRPDGTPLAVRGRSALAGVSGNSPTESAEPSDFRSEMAQALKSVSRSQSESSRLQREVQLENPTVSLEETMVAMQKAQLGFQAVVQVRNRLVQAYSEVMNMQV